MNFMAFNLLLLIKINRIFMHFNPGAENGFTKIT